MSGVVQVTVTAGDEEEARRLGLLAVEGRLVACAQVSGPVTSTYRWRGEVTSAVEWLCVMKTTTELVEALVVALREAHGYEVPEIVAVPVTGGDADYLAWVRAETGPAASDRPATTP